MSESQRTGLLARPSAPFPKRQLYILALCRICEPIAFMSIFPYIYPMIDSFNLTNDNRKIAVYIGMVTSAFTFAEFATGALWGRLSDEIGRKPVLLTGLAGTGLSMLLFGFAPNLFVALLARAIGGLLNGNLGVLQTTVAELVTAKEHQPRAYAIMPIISCVGSILGPSLGGALAQPCVNYPERFPPDTIFEKFPYLLPNLVCAMIVFCSLVVGILFLEETHSEKKHRWDPGLKTGQWIRNRVLCCMSSNVLKHEMVPSLPVPPAPEQSLPCRTTEQLPQPHSTAVAFTTQVVLNIVSYGILAYHTITFDQLFPVLLSTPSSEGGSSSNLFKFAGGFGLPAREIGFILSVQGFSSLVAVIIIFPAAVQRLGALKLFRILVLSYPILYLITPYLILLPDWAQMCGIYTILTLKCTLAAFAYPTSAILLTNSAPSLLLLGTINGVAASGASLSRAIGPTFSGMLYSVGLRTGYAALVWWCNAIFAGIGALISLQMMDPNNRTDVACGAADLENNPSS